MAKWKQIRDLTVAQVAEAGAPVEANFATVDSDFEPKDRVELSFDALTFGGTVAASAVTFGIWRMSGTRIDKVGTLTFASGVTPISQVIESFGAEKIHARVESFTGGTAPTIATKIYARGF